MNSLNWVIQTIDRFSIRIRTTYTRFSHLDIYNFNPQSKKPLKGKKKHLPIPYLYNFEKHKQHHDIRPLS